MCRCIDVPHAGRTFYYLRCLQVRKPGSRMAGPLRTWEISGAAAYVRDEMKYDRSAALGEKPFRTAVLSVSMCVPRLTLLRFDSHSPPDTHLLMRGRLLNLSRWYDSHLLLKLFFSSLLSRRFATIFPPSLAVPTAYVSFYTRARVYIYIWLIFYYSYLFRKK